MKKEENYMCYLKYFYTMPRGVKKKAFVGRSTGDESGAIVTHFYVNNHRLNLTKFKNGTFKKYCKIAKKRVEIKLKEEKHSS